MSAPRAIIQMLVTGTRIVGRAFVDAYKQAAANTAAARAAAGQGDSRDTVSGKDVLSKKTGISLDESMKILNIEDIHNSEEFKKKFEHLYKANDPEEGGSFYLLSKVVRARERIEMELAQIKKAAKEQTERGEGGDNPPKAE